MDKSARSKLKFALFGNIYQASKSASIQKLLSILQQRDADVLVEKAYYDFLTKVQQVVFPYFCKRNRNRLVIKIIA